MPNIEIKARYSDLEKARQIALRFQTQYLGKFHQIDTYFETKVKEGRLKLREVPNEGAWLIPYLKTYEKRPARSDYQVIPVLNASETKLLLTKLLEVKSTVDKKREVFLIENVRIHLDEVVGLGSFLEFEAVFERDTLEAQENETRKVWELMTTFDIHPNDLVTEGYLDLLKS